MGKGSMKGKMNLDSEEKGQQVSVLSLGGFFILV